MILSFSWQLKLFLFSILIGLFSGFFYDLIRVLRTFILHIKVFIHIEDIIYWIFLGISIFLIAFCINEGEIRPFFLIGIFLGMTLYFLLISKIFLKISNKIICFLKKVLLFIIECILAPFKLIINILLLILNPILLPIKNIIIKIKLKLKNVLQKNKKCVKIYSMIKAFKLRGVNKEQYEKNNKN